MVGAGTHHKKKKKKKKKTSVCTFFKQQLINLMTTLNVTEPYFCRAMKPNWNKSSKEWDNVLVEDQLRSGGLIEALRVLKLGYPTRVPYKRIWDKFNGKINNPLINNLDQMGFAEAVLMAFSVDSSTYCLGLTKIFFKPAKAAVLDTIMASAGKPLSAEQNAMITKFVQEKRLKQVIGGCKIFLKLSLRIRFKRARDNLQKYGRVLGMVARTVIRHADYAKNAILIKAAQAIQSYFRAKKVYQDAKPMVEERKVASQKIFHMWRRFEERTKLMEWLLQNCDAAKARAEELKNLSPEERKAREEKRKAERAAAAAAAAEQAAAEKAAKEAAGADAEAAAAAAREAAMASQNDNAGNMEDADKLARQAQAKRAEAMRLAAEKAQRDKENSELWKLLHPQSSGEDEDYEDETGEHHVRHTVSFYRESSSGHMFTIYQARKNRTPHERFVKISYNADKEPVDISWGAGEGRRIPWGDVKFVVKGCLTKTMQVWKAQVDPDLCFSVITPTRTLDMSSSDAHGLDIWVNGITKLLNQTEDDRHAAEMAYDPDGEVVDDIDKPREKTASQLQTQRALFTMNVKTCFREINFEGLYGFIPDNTQDEFLSDVFYQKCLASGTPWRIWDSWIRDEVVKYLVDNGMVDSAVAEAHEADVKAARPEVDPNPPPLQDCLIA